MQASPAQLFVIYSLELKVLGFVFHCSGDRAAEKAEAETGLPVVLWNAWKNATPRAQAEAQCLGEIT